MTFKPASWPRKLRSQEWYGGTSRDNIYHRGWLKNQGYPDDLFDGRPVIGIMNTWSELTPCNGHLRDLAEKVKAGIWEAGGFPLEVPVFSASENTFRPSAMMYRNLAALAVEEQMRGQPIDGAVLLVGCDKTTPSLIMGAASTDIPSIVVTGGPMLNGWFQGERLGSGPAVDARRRVMAQLSGRRIVQMVKDDLKPSDILTRAAFENAIRTNGAIGGSTNAVIHMLAIAGRVGIDVTLDDWDRLGRDVPTIVNLMPSGKYLMEEFFYAGGLPVVLRHLGEAGLLNRDALTVSGGAIWDEVKQAKNWNEDVIRPAERALTASGGIAVLKGNLAPDGAVLKPSAASPHLMQHRGRAVVFEDIDDYKARIGDDELDIDETCVMVLKNCGPKGYPGMPEVGNMGLPPKVLKKGITDMIRISDARMSGTAYGTVILHVAPEAAAGGPLAVVKSGDMIEVNVAARRLHLDVPDDELAARLAAWTPGVQRPASGYAQMFHDRVEGADTGADFDFLKGCRGREVARDSH